MLDEPLPGERRRAAVRFAGRAGLDVAADVLGLGHVADDQVGSGARGGRPRFLVGVLSVDHRGEAVALVAVHVLPDVHHRAAGGVHQDGALAAQHVQFGRGNPESGQEHHVLRTHLGEFLLRRPGIQEQDPELGETAVHVGVVDDLARQEDPPIGKAQARLVGVLDRPVHPVAEAEFVGDQEPELTGPQPIVVIAGETDQVPPIVLGQRFDDLFPEPQTPAVVDAGRRQFGARRGQFRAGGFGYGILGGRHALNDTLSVHAGCPDHRPPEAPAEDSRLRGRRQVFRPRLRDVHRRLPGQGLHHPGARPRTPGPSARSAR